MFVHLDHPADKMQLLLHMLHKLYGLVSLRASRSGRNRGALDINLSLRLHQSRSFHADFASLR